MASADTSEAEGAAAGETALSPSVFRCADRARGRGDRVPEEDQHMGCLKVATSECLPLQGYMPVRARFSLF